MRKNLAAMAMAACAVMGIGMAIAGDEYTIDAMHSGVTFQITHLDLTWIHGRFNEFSGDITLDTSDPSKSSFKMTIKPDSVDTNSPKRDGHLKSPDFFNTKQYPSIDFVSTSVTPAEGGYQVTGNLTFHGETKPVTFTLKGGKKIEFPKGVQAPATRPSSRSSAPSSASARRASRRCSATRCGWTSASRPSRSNAIRLDRDRHRFHQDIARIGWAGPETPRPARLAALHLTSNPHRRPRLSTSPSSPW